MTFPPQAIVAAVPLTAGERRDPPDLKRAKTVEKGHGRIETRSIQVRTKLPSRLNETWPGLTAICRIERIREMADRCSREVIYAITSVSPDKLDAAGMLQLSRDHWAIESAPQAHKKEVRDELIACAQAARKMKVDPSESAFRSGLQTTPSGCG